jgi:hypothetical protein
MSGGVDYSKWDSLCVSGDDDSDKGSLVDSEDAMPCHSPPQHAAADRVGARPVVTRLDHPSTVSIGPSGVQVNHPPRASASPFLSAPTLRPAEPANNSSTLTSRQPQREDADITDDLEDDLLILKLTRNGQRCDGYFWTQIRDMATVSIILPSLSIRGGNIHNFRIAKTSESCDVSVDGAAVISFDIVVHPADASRDQHVSYALRYPIKCDEETTDGCWQLHTLAGKGMRILVVELHKDMFGQGLYLWWDRACVGEAPIDTTKLEDRKMEQSKPVVNVQRIWNEAHEEFRRRNKTRTSTVNSE